MLIEAIGESFKKIDEKTQGLLLPSRTEVPWKAVKGMRDRIAHGYGIIWKIKEKCLYLQRERRSQVEPRCAERWHLRDDEQFDLAAWFPSLKYRAGHELTSFLLYSPIKGTFVYKRMRAHQ